MSNIDYIMNLCIDLAEQGKAPSVGLIKKMAQHPLSIPEIVKGLQRFKEHPNARPALAKTTNNNAPLNQSLLQRVTQLETQVNSIMQELEKLRVKEKP